MLLDVDPVTLDETKTWEPDGDIVHEGCPKCSRKPGPYSSFCGIVVDWRAEPFDTPLDRNEQECTMCAHVNECPSCGWRVWRRR